MKLSPIVLFVYKRPKHTKKVLEALADCELANKSHLYIFCDGPKANESKETIKFIEEVRTVVKSKKWCAKVTVYESNVNLGLAKSIISGVTKIVKKHGKVIVLEDDIVVSKVFLKYMNEALEFYQDAGQVMQISAYFPPINTEGSLPTTFFYNHNSCWGWGTWDRAWSYYNDDVQDLLNLLKVDENFTPINFSKGFGIEAYFQLVQNLNKKISTWAVKWHAAIYLKKGFILHPAKSLVKNIGVDGSGENSGFFSFGINSRRNLPINFPYEFSNVLTENNNVIRLVKCHYWLNILNNFRFIKRIAILFFNVYVLKIWKT